MSDDTDDYQPKHGNLLSSIERFESNGRNVLNYRFQEDPNMYTASGYYQITNSTWKDIAKAAGIDLDKYPTAMSAPKSVQAKAADALIDQRGLQPWSMNNRLMAHFMGQPQPTPQVQMASAQPQIPDQGLSTAQNPLMQQPQMPQLTPQQLQMAQYQRLQGLLQSIQAPAPQITGYTTA